MVGGCTVRQFFLQYDGTLYTLVVAVRHAGAAQKLTRFTLRAFWPWPNDGEHGIAPRSALFRKLAGALTPQVCLLLRGQAYLRGGWGERFFLLAPEIQYCHQFAP